MRTRTVAFSAGLALVAVLCAPAMAAVAEPAAHHDVTALSPAECKLQSPLDSFNEGFVLDASAAPATGSLTAQVLYMDFPDHVGGGEGDATIERIRAGIADGVENLELQSGGRLDVIVREYPDRLTFPHPVSHYAQTEHSVWSAEEFAAVVGDAVGVADPVVDFRGIDVVWVVSPWAFPLAWYNQASNSLDIEADGNIITRAVTFPTVSDSNLEPLVVHETGHSFGLPDLYDTSDLGNARYLGTWDPMSGTRGATAGEFMGWHLWRLGWIDDDQVTCLSPSARGDMTLDALTRRGASVIAVIPTSAGRAIVVESRKAERHDADIPKPGVLISLVYPDTSFGAVNVGARDGTEFPTDPEGFADATLLPGDRYTDWASGLTITVVASTDGSDTVRFGGIGDAGPTPDPDTGAPAPVDGVPPPPAAQPASAATLPPTGVAPGAVTTAAFVLLLAGTVALFAARPRRFAGTRRNHGDSD